MTFILLQGSVSRVRHRKRFYREIFTRTRKIALPQVFATLVAQAKETSASLRVRFCDNDTDQLQADCTEYVDFAESGQTL